MKITQFALYLTLVASTDAASLRGGEGEGQRDLQQACETTLNWHPNYQLGWTNGRCSRTRTCDSPGYDTEVDCCNNAYRNQESGACYASLPSPPTSSPTGSGGLDIWYPDYDTAWPEAGCLNVGPKPSGRPEYATQLDCCKEAYRNQLSGACLSELPSPPTTSPTGVGGLDIWYPDPNKASWASGTCINDAPFPNNVGQGYADMLECCKTAFAGQESGECLAALPSPPTSSPTATGGLDVWYPDPDVVWTDGTCINTRPMPNTVGQPYDTQIECCKLAYAGQMSGACLAALPSPPTSSPTATGGLDVYYPDPDAVWSDATCINTRPMPNNVGQPFDDMLSCCKQAFAGQTSGACLAALPSPPTSSPTGAGGLDVWYADPDRSSWNAGTCINDGPLPNNSGPTYATQLDCCKEAYSGQTSGDCLADLPSPPTSSPTAGGGLDIWYADPDRSSWAQGTCINDAPLPNNAGTEYDSQEDCCTGAYPGQAGFVCHCDYDECYSCACPGAATNAACVGILDCD